MKIITSQNKECARHVRLYGDIIRKKQMVK